MPDVREELTELRKFGDEEIEVVFRKLQKTTETAIHYEPFAPGVTVENDIVCERDVAAPLRDGTLNLLECAGAEPSALTCSGVFSKHRRRVWLVRRGDGSQQAGMPGLVSDQ